MMASDDVYFFHHLVHDLKIGTATEVRRRMSISEFFDWRAFYVRRRLEQEQERLKHG